MSISSTGLYGSATIVNSDLFTDVETLKETVTTLNTTYLQTTAEHRADISQNRTDISSNLSKINDISTNKIPNKCAARGLVTFALCRRHHAFDGGMGGWVGGG